MHIIAIMGLKGGVGKTTAAINIAATLAAMDKRVLLVELSKQGNIANFFNITALFTVSDVLSKSHAISRAIIETEINNLDVVVSDLSILNVKSEVDALKNALSTIDEYDYCVMDCEPTFDAVIINAIIAADKIYMPIKPDSYSIEAAKDMIEQIGQLDDSKIGGIFVNAIGKGKRDLLAVDTIKEQLEIMPVVIHKSQAIERMSWDRKPINKLSRKSKAAAEYAALTAEIIAGLSDSDN